MRVDFVECESWEGLYVDGRLAVQDCPIAAWDVLRALEGVSVEKGTYFYGYATFDEEEGQWTLPVNLEDVVLYGGKTVKQTWEESQ